MPSVNMAEGTFIVPKTEKWAEKRRKSGGMGRPSLAPEHMLSANDDQVEKENARQNARTPTDAGGATPFKSMQGDVKKRQSFDTRGGEMSMTPKGGRLDGERLQSLYGDCIKLANENKITQKNAWTMNLLDHIRGLTGSGSETDFVTAGCTLDAAGKIYSCRVDSVHNETFRVCTGLSRSAPLATSLPPPTREASAAATVGSDFCCRCSCGSFLRNGEHSPPFHRILLTLGVLLASSKPCFHPP